MCFNNEKQFLKELFNSTLINTFFVYDINIYDMEKLL